MKRFDIYLTALDPAKGKELQKTRPSLIISPDEMNKNLSTVIIAPMTTKMRAWPSRVEVEFSKKTGQIALDQIRAIDKQRLVKKLGVVQERTGDKVLKILREIFE